MQHVEQQIAPQATQPQAPRAIQGPNQGLDQRWVNQVSRRGLDAEGFTGVGEGLQAVAKSVDTFPARIVEQTQVVQYAFWTGGAFGFMVCAVLAFLITAVRRTAPVLLVVALVGLAGCEMQPAPPIVPPLTPIPEPAPLPDPPCPPNRPWPPRQEPGSGSQDLEDNNHVAPDGKTEGQVDYPDGEWMRNIGSKIDGAGMCVFTSAEHAFRNQGLDEFRGFRDWCAAAYPGGGYPDKLHKLILAFCKAKGIQTTQDGGVTWIIRPRTGERFTYIQYEGAAMSLAEAGLREGILMCSTLYRSPRYGAGIIYHMVNLAHWGPGGYGAILDNNYKPYEWDTMRGMEPRLKLQGTVWLVAVIRQGPPPPPS